MAPGRSLLGAAKWRASYFEETEMTKFATAPRALAFAAAIALPLGGGLSAQEQAATVDVYGEALVAGPDVDGIISARRDNRIQITAEDGTSTVVTIDQDTEVKGKGGFLGLGNKTLAAGESWEAPCRTNTEGQSWLTSLPLGRSRDRA